MSVTSRERMRMALSGLVPDRVPFHPTIFTDHACLACGKRFEDALVNPAIGNECMLGAALYYQTDGVRFVMGPPQAWYEEKMVVEQDGRLLQVSRQTGKAEGFFDIAGGGALFPFEPVQPVRTLDDVSKIPVPTAEELRQQGCFKDVERYVHAAHEHGLFAVGLCSGQTLNFIVGKMGGETTPALLLFYDDPALVRALITKAVAISIEKGKAFIASGVDCVYIGDSWASASVISPAMYRQFCVPAYAELAQELHRQGVLVYKHCCGNYNPLLDDFQAVGVDGMDGLDPTSGMSVRRTKQKIGATTTLIGGLSCLTLLNGTPDEVYAEATQCVLDGKPDGRYILGSGCAVPRLTPFDNLRAARAAAVDHGSYDDREQA